MQMPKREDVEKLKASWEEDPCWDLYHTEGYEEFHDELKAHQEKMEAEWAAAARARLEKTASELGVRVEVAEKVADLERRSVSQHMQASRLLTHYFKLAGIPMSPDNEAEIREIASSIIDASVSKVTAEMMLDFGRKESGSASGK